MPDEIRAYVAARRDEDWVIAFGRLEDDRGAFLIAYEAVQVAGQPDSFSVPRYAPARVDSGYLASAARALDTARTEFGSVGRPYNLAPGPGEP